MTKRFPVAGNVPAVVTPFGPDGDLRLDAFEALVAWHVAQGVDGVCIAGDNGESWTLSVDERRRLALAAVRVAAGRIPVVMGASATTARQSIAYAEAVADTGVAALMIGPQPYVMKATTRELVQRLETVHRAVPLPMLLYNSPRRTNISLTVETMRAICDAVPVIALKEASRDFFYLTHVIHHFRDRLAVMIGPAPFILPGLQLGAAGFISSGPELLGGRAARIMALASGAMTEEARGIQEGVPAEEIGARGQRVLVRGKDASTELSPRASHLRQTAILAPVDADPPSHRPTHSLTHPRPYPAALGPQPTHRPAEAAGLHRRRRAG